MFIAFVADYLSGGGTEVGVIRGSAAFGGIVSGLIIARFADGWDAPTVMVGGYALFFVVGLGFVNAPSFTTTLWVYVVLFGLSGFPNVTSQVGTSATLQQLAPARRSAALQDFPEPSPRSDRASARSLPARSSS